MIKLIIPDKEAVITLTILLYFLSVEKFLKQKQCYITTYPKQSNFNLSTKTHKMHLSKNVIYIFPLKMFRLYTEIVLWDENLASVKEIKTESMLAH